MAMVSAVQKGKMESPSKSVSEAAKSMTKSDASDFARTKHKGLPEQVSKSKDKSVKKASYINHLTNEERSQAIKFGAMAAFLSYNIPISKVDDVVKSAFTLPSVGNTLEGVSKAIITTAVLTGVPLGVAAHMIGKSIDSNRRAERERLARIKYYRDATRQLESGLTGTPESEVKQ